MNCEKERNFQAVTSQDSNQEKDESAYAICSRDLSSLSCRGAREAPKKRVTEALCPEMAEMLFTRTLCYSHSSVSKQLIGRLCSVTKVMV